jgi:hypothetical protein
VLLAPAVALAPVPTVETGRAFLFVLLLTINGLSDPLTAGLS